MQKRYVIVLLNQFYIHLTKRLLLNLNSVDAVLVPDNDWGIIHTSQTIPTVPISILSPGLFLQYLREKSGYIIIIISGASYRNLIDEIIQDQSIQKNNEIKIIGDSFNEFVKKSCPHELIANQFVGFPKPAQIPPIVFFVVSTNQYSCSEITSEVISKILQAKGMKPVLLNYVSLMWDDDYTDLMKNALSLSDRMNAFQGYCFEKSSAADAIIVEYPSDIGLWSGSSNLNCSEFSLIAKFSLEPDFCMACLPANAVINNWLDDNYTKISTLIGFHLDCIGIGPVFINDAADGNYEYIECIRDELLCGIEKQRVQFIALYDDIESITKAIERKLSTKPDVL